jgi:hypothetical protein
VKQISALSLALMTLLTLCGCGGGVAEELPDPIEPYYDYFAAFGPQGVFLMPTLRQKQAFDREPVAATNAGQPPTSLPTNPDQPVRPTTRPWAVFIDRTGTQIFVAGDEELVERIRVAYEERQGTVLLPAASIEAPPLAEPATQPNEGQAGD